MSFETAYKVYPKMKCEVYLLIAIQLNIQIVWYASFVYKIMNVTIIIKEKQCGTVDTITGNVHFVISFCTC